MKRQPPAPKVVTPGAVASKIPWRVVHSESSICGPMVEVRCADGKIVCDNEQYYPQAVTPENAALIVKAVNSHAALVQALKDLLKECPLSDHNVKKDFSFMVARAAAVQALHEIGECGAECAHNAVKTAGQGE